AQFPGPVDQGLRRRLAVAIVDEGMCDAEAVEPLGRLATGVAVLQSVERGHASIPRSGPAAAVRTRSASFSIAAGPFLPEAKYSARRRSVRQAAQQVVDAGLAAGLLVDLLDDHRAVQRMRAIARRQRSGYHHAARRHVAVADLAGGAVVDAGGLADEHAHPDHAVVADHHALHHFRARADEAVVLDDGRAGLQRLQHATD